MSELTFVNFRSKAEVFAPVDAPRYAHFFSFFIYYKGLMCFIVD